MTLAKLNYRVAKPGEPTCNSCCHSRDNWRLWTLWPCELATDCLVNVYSNTCDRHEPREPKEDGAG